MGILKLLLILFFSISLIFCNTLPVPIDIPEKPEIMDIPNFEYNGNEGDEYDAIFILIENIERLKLWIKSVENHIDNYNDVLGE